MLARRFLWAIAILIVLVIVGAFSLRLFQRQLLETALEITGADAELVWATPEQVAAAGVEPWTQLPIWVPPTGELAGLHAADVTRALAAGLVVRPVRETVADTWAWLRAEGWPTPRADRPPVGLDPDVEARVLAAL